MDTVRHPTLVLILTLLHRDLTYTHSNAIGTHVHAMALKREAQLGGTVRGDGLVCALLLLCRLLAKVLDSHSAFNRPYSKALLVGKY